MMNQESFRDLLMNSKVINYAPCDRDSMWVSIEDDYGFVQTRIVPKTVFDECNPTIQDQTRRKR